MAKQHIYELRDRLGEGRFPAYDVLRDGLSVSVDLAYTEAERDILSRMTDDDRYKQWVAGPVGHRYVTRQEIAEQFERQRTYDREYAEEDNALVARVRAEMKGITA
jgi:hypothetical protein